MLKSAHQATDTMGFIMLLPTFLKYNYPTMVKTVRYFSRNVK